MRIAKSALQMTPNSKVVKEITGKTMNKMRLSGDENKVTK